MTNPPCHPPRFGTLTVDTHTTGPMAGPFPKRPGQHSPRRMTERNARRNAKLARNRQKSMSGETAADVCRHCAQKCGRWRRRGLCPICYRQPDVRASYLPVDRGPKGAGPRQDFYGPAPVPEAATPLLPGDGPRYLDVLAERAARGEELVSPYDAVRAVNLN